MKIVKVQIASGHSFQGIRSGMSQLKPGDACDVHWGGGVVTSLTYDRDLNSIVVRKDRKFRHQDGKMPEFDALLIPFALVEAIAMADEAVDVKAASSEELANAVTPVCSKCGAPSGGKPLCPKCYEAAKGKGK
jgi:hypothetical protein